MMHLSFANRWQYNELGGREYAHMMFNSTTVSEYFMEINKIIYQDRQLDRPTKLMKNFPQRREIINKDYDIFFRNCRVV